MAGWSLPKNEVDQTGDGAPAVLPDAVAAGDCLFALVTQSDDVELAVQDVINGAWTTLGFVPTGDASRTAQLSCFLGSAAAAGGALSISAPGGDNAANILAWAHTPPDGTTGLAVGDAVQAGGTGTAIDAGTLTTDQVALLVAGMRMRPNSGPVISAGTDFTTVPGTGAGYLHAEYAVDEPAGSYPGAFTSDTSLDGWAAVAAAIYATVPGVTIAQRRTGRSAGTRAGSRQRR